MQSACNNGAVAHIQIRNVPPDLHRLLKARAAKAGMSLSEYLLSELKRDAELPTMDEWLARVRSRPLYEFEVTSAELIREDRANR
jgi:plasmid stability protein